MWWISGEETPNAPVLLSNSLECLIKAAQQGKGIIAAYEKLTIFKGSNLKNIMPDVSLKRSQHYFIYPDYLKDDPDIKDIKHHFKRSMEERV